VVDAFCYGIVRPSVRACVCDCVHPLNAIFINHSREFDQIYNFVAMHLGTEMNQLDFELEMSNVKAVCEQNMVKGRMSMHRRI